MEKTPAGGETSCNLRIGTTQKNINFLHFQNKPGCKIEFFDVLDGDIDFLLSNKSLLREACAAQLIHSKQQQNIYVSPDFSFISAFEPHTPRLPNSKP